MTGSSDCLIGMQAHTRVPPRACRWRVRVMLPALLLVAAALTVVPARAQEMLAGRVTATTDHGFTRLVFKFDQAVPAQVSLTWPIMIIHFDKPVDLSVDRLNEHAPGYISAARRDPDGTAVRIALVQKVKYHVIPAGERLFVDLLPENWSGLLPGLPQEVIDELARRAGRADKLIDKARLAEQKALADPVRVRVATQPTFSRYVFELLTTTHIDPERGDGTYTLNFDQPIKWDLADALAALPPSVETIDTVRADRSTTVRFKLIDDPELRTFRDGRSFMVDIGRGGVAPNQALAAGAAKLAATDPESRGVAPPETMPAQAIKPAAPVAAATPDDGAPPMVDMPQPDAAPGTKPAPPPSPQIMVPAPDREASKPSPAMKAAAAPGALVAPARPELRKPDLTRPEMQKPDLANSEMATPPMAKPDLVKPDMARPEVVMPEMAERAALPKSGAQGTMLKPLEPIAPSPKRAPPKTASPETAKNAPAMHDSEPVGQPAATVPSPNTNVPVVAGIHRDGRTLTIEFPFAVPTPAAVFHRADMLWLVFDNPAKISLGQLAAEADGAIQNATVRRSEDGAAVVRIRLSRPRLISVDSDGPAWTVTIGDSITTASHPLGIVRTKVSRDRANLVIPFENPGKLHRLHDPEVGDNILVMTGLAPVRGFLRAQDFVELDALASRHGVVVRPIADDVTGKVTRDGVLFTRPGGLALSAAMDARQQSAASFRATTFDNQLWSLDREGNYFGRQSELLRIASSAPPGQRKVARLNLARFYLARDMSAEAMGVLKVAFAGQHDDVTGSVLRSVANLMMGRPKDALKDLSQPQVGNQLDASVWRAIAFARQGKWSEAHKLFRDVETSVAALPLELQRMAMLEALHAAVEVRDFSKAERLVNLIDGVGFSPRMKPQFDVLVGRLDEGLGRHNEALAKYQEAAEAGAGPATAQGKLREIELLYHLGQMSQSETVAALETLTTIWRGDETEAEGLRLLAHLYTNRARYREAFHVMRVALLAHPNSDLTRKIQEEAAATFENLFLSNKGDTLSPIEALGLFYDYRELTPIGRRGDEMIRRLADRLVAVDLLDQAAKLLQHQVDNRLQGAARAQVATRLAIIYLMDHKPDRALATLQSTRAAQLNNELRDQRLLLQARALSDLGRYDLALQVIHDIKGHQAMRLRADILWAGHRWRQAAEQIELMHGERWRDFRPLDAGERFDILRGAIGYALAEEPLSLQRFREKYAAKMENGPDGHAFSVVSAPIGTANAEFRSVATHVSSVDTLDAFLNDMRKRYPDANADSAQGEGDQGAAPKPSPPDTVPATDPKPGPGALNEGPETSKPAESGRAAANVPAGPAGPVSPQSSRVPQGASTAPAGTTGSIGRR